MRFIDLSHPISENTPTYPTDPDVQFIREKEIEKDNTLLHSFKMGTHTGTHLDVPAHVILGQKTVENYKLTSFTGNAIKINDATMNRLKDVDNNIDGIIYDSGWYRHYNDPETFFGRERPVIPAEIIEGASKREIYFFGCDLPSVDHSGSKNKPIHNALLGNNIIIYESLTNLDQLPLLYPFTFYGFPLPFIGLDGSPVRAVAMLE